MRVGTGFLYQSIQQRIGQLSSGLRALNEKIASGKKSNRPSDNPVAMVNAMQLKTALAQLDQYGHNLNTGTSWLNLSESAVSQTLDLVGRAKEIATQMASSTQTADTRAVAATEVGQLLDQAISLGNTQLGGKYIFAGYRTNTVPFSKVTVGGIETAQYNGDTSDFRVQIGKSETLTAGKNGQKVLMDSTIFDTLGYLKKALENNDQSSVGAQLDNLTTVENHINNQIADIGAQSNLLDTKQGVINSLNTDLQEKLSQAQDADMAEVTIQFNTKQLTYQAALAAAARIDQLTLLNYMK